MASERQKQGGPSRPDRRSSGGSKGGRTVWDSPDISPEVVEELILRFFTVVRLPEERVRAVSEDWGSKSLVAMPLGRRVSAEVAARELRLRGDLKGEVTGLPMDEKIILLRFTKEEDRKRILHRPWIISGQILAVEPWRPCFFPTSSSIRSAVVWIRLPALPVEFWEEDLLRQITEGAGEMEYLDECTIHRRRLGFARVAVRISLAQPLRPGVLIEGLGG